MGSGSSSSPSLFSGASHCMQDLFNRIHYSPSFSLPLYPYPKDDDDSSTVESVSFCCLGATFPHSFFFVCSQVSIDKLSFDREEFDFEGTGDDGDGNLEEWTGHCAVTDIDNLDLTFTARGEYEVGDGGTHRLKMTLQNGCITIHFRHHQRIERFTFLPEPHVR